MKKTIVVSLLLTIGLSSCDPFPYPDHWLYLQAKSQDGTVLGTSVVSQMIIAGALSGNITLEKVEDTEEVTIESTYPLWTLENLNHQLSTNGGASYHSANNFRYSESNDPADQNRRKLAENDDISIYYGGSWTNNLLVKRKSSNEGIYHIYVKGYADLNILVAPSYTGFEVRLPAIP